MGSTENFHREIVRRLQSGELRLGVDRSFASNSKSVAFSKFWTLFAFYASAAGLGTAWQLGGPWWWYVAIPVASFLAGSVMGFMRGGTRVRKLATSDPYMFDALWGEGALGLKLLTGKTCSSLTGENYRAFVAQHFLQSKPCHQPGLSAYEKESFHE